jgi:transposase
MLWESSKMEQRYDAVLGVVRDGFTVTEVAQKFGVSRQAVHSWLKRYEEGGLEALGERSHRATTARRGKDDAIDAEMAARKVLSGEASAQAKDTTGSIESIRLLKLARESAIKARTVALLQIRDVLITAPSELREHVEAAGGSHHRVNRAGALRPDLEHLDEPLQAAKFSLRLLSRRVKFLDEETATMDAQLSQLVETCAPNLLGCRGIGIQHAATLLITAGQNLDRLSNDRAFARLCGVAPIPISSGKTNRMRLHRGGNRQANKTLHLIAVARLRLDPRTQVYMERRRPEGLSKRVFYAA